MPVVATPFRRRLAMAAMLALAVVGSVMRALADDPSPMRDVGTLLMVMWLPAVGNLVGFVMRQLGRRARAPLEFTPGSAFRPQLQARMEAVPLPAGFAASLDPVAALATLVAGRNGFTVRLEQPVAQWLAAASTSIVEFEALRPEAAVPVLTPGTDVHLLVGRTVVAKGRMLGEL